MANTILILGNGPSRLEYMDFVNKFTGPIWGSNWIFQDLISGTLKKLDRLNGDYDALEVAEVAKREHNFTYDMWAFTPNGYHVPGVIKCTDILPRYDSNSGLRWVVKALLERVDRMYLVGFDFGGKDLYVPNHDKLNKSDWITKFRLVLHDFGHDKIEFIGKDHMPFLLSKEPADTYANLYLKGEDHLKGNLKWPNKKSNKVLILGNGVSRLQYKSFIDNWKDEIWIFNQAYKEYQTLPRVDRVFCDYKTLKMAIEFRAAVRKDWKIYTIDDVNFSGVEVVSGIKGMTSGASALEQALIEQYDKILLCGFDFSGEDIHVGNQTVGSEFIRHFKWVTAKYNTSNINFIGKTPAWWGEKEIYSPPKEIIANLSKFTQAQIKQGFQGF